MAKNPLLIGTAEFIDLVQPQVRDMLAVDGFYIGGDTDAPDGGEVPLVVIDGRVFCMLIDCELQPDRFKPGLTLAGPFRAKGKDA